jgi:hypothetical protein
MSPYVKKGGHGGHRDGVGRPSLSRLDRLLIGAKAEKEFQTRAKLLKYDLAHDEIEQSRDVLMRVPIAERKNLPADAQEHLNWLGEELDGKRLLWAERRLLPEVLTRVAADESTSRGTPISSRQVRRWRDEYLKTKRQKET